MAAMKTEEGDAAAATTEAAAAASTAEQTEAKGSTGGGRRPGGGRAGAGGLKKGPWTPTEDAILMEHVRRHGEGNWNAVQRHSGLARCGKSCRLRWANHLRPNLKKGSFSPEEELLILRLHAQLGNKWARMAAQMPGRTDNEIKNYWNTRLKRRQRAGLPIYPPELQEAIRLNRIPGQQQQEQPSSGTQPLSAADSRASHLPFMQMPQLMDPLGFCPPPEVTLPPLPRNLFSGQLGLGMPLQSMTPPSTSPPILQKQPLSLGNYDPYPRVFPPKIELPSTQFFPVPGNSDGRGAGQTNNCGLLEALLQETSTVEDIRIGDLLAMPPAGEQGVRWGQLFCGDGNFEDCIDEVSLGNYPLDSDLAGSKFKTDVVNPVKDNITALLDMTPPPMSDVPDWYNNADSTELSNVTSPFTASDDFGIDLHQMPSSAEQDWNINSWPWNDMPGIC